MHVKRVIIHLLSPSLFLVSTTAPHILAATKPTSPAESVLGTILLPPSLFKTLSDDKSRDGIWFSLHENANFFPIIEDAAPNETVGSPVISATVGGESIVKLSEPVLFTLRILNEVSHMCTVVVYSA